MSVSESPTSCSKKHARFMLISAAGRCSGRFTNERGRVKELDGAHARYVARNRGDISCAGGTARGRGFLEIRDEKLRFRLTETRAAGAAALDLEGAHGGSATGEARVSEEEDPAEIAEKCSTSGLRRTGVNIDLTTRPAISG